MNVVHLTNSISHSSAPLRIVKALEGVGVDSKTIVFNSDDEYSQVIKYKRNIFEKIETHFISKKNSKIMSAYNGEGLPFSMGSPGIDASKIDLVKKADVIHLHWVNAEFLSFKSIDKIMKLGKPVVWTFHDSWPMTGGCHVRYGCDRFMTGCGKCHELNSEDENDITSHVIKEKQKYYHAENIITVSPSKWMYGNVCKSLLFGKSRNYQIGNPLDTDLFFGKDSFTEFNKKEKINILFGSSGTISSKYKGYRYFVEAMKILRENNPILSEKVVINIFGTTETRFPDLSGYETKSLGYINSDEKMAEAYRNADIYVFPSLDDNLPGTVMECLSCETPVVCFDTCGVPEMVKHKETGYVARFKDSEDLEAGIKWVYENNNGNSIGKKGRMYINDNYSNKIISQQYVELYKEIMLSI